MKIQIYGTGCPNCTKLEESARQAAFELGFNTEIEKVKEIKDIVSAGILRTPALGIDGRLVSQGRLLSVEQIKSLLGDRRTSV